MNIFFLILNFLNLLLICKTQEACFHRNPLHLIKTTVKPLKPLTNPTTTKKTTTTSKTTTSTTTTKRTTTTSIKELTALLNNLSTNINVNETYDQLFQDSKQSFIPPGLDPSIDMSKFNPLNLSPIQMSILQVLLMGTCYRDSYGRGAGVGVSYCNETTDDKDGSLCYPKCEDGFVGNGPVCWEKCKPEFTDRGMYCNIDLDIISKGCCCDFDDACCNICPKNYTDDGCTCRRPPKSYSKKYYGRGAGTVLSCKPDEELNGLLCYPLCRDGYGGNGPICWKNCNPPLNTECGAICALNQPNCVVKSVSLVTVLGPPFQAFANLAGGIISIGQIPSTYILPPCLT